MHLCTCGGFYTISVQKKCIESTGESENVIFKTLAELYPFKVYAYMHQLSVGDGKSA